MKHWGSWTHTDFDRHKVKLWSSHAPAPLLSSPVKFSFTDNNYILRVTSKEISQSQSEHPECSACCNPPTEPWNLPLSPSLSLVAKQLTYLLVLQLDAHHSEGVVGSVVVDVDAAESLLSGLDGHPLLTGVIVDHDWGPRLADTLLAGGRNEGRRTRDEGGS